MATLTFEAWCGTPAWNAIGSDTLVFSGSAVNLATFIASGTFNYGTHLGNGLPGADQCGTNHVNNNMLVSSTTISINGGTAVTLNDTNLPDTSCTMRLHFNDSGSYSVQNGRIYSYDGITTTNPAVGVDAAIYVKGQAMSQWFTLNSQSTTGPAISGMNFQTANIGGDNTGSQVFLNGASGATDYYYMCAVSVSPETPGGKASFSLGSYIEYY